MPANPALTLTCFAAEDGTPNESLVQLEQHPEQKRRLHTPSLGEQTSNWKFLRKSTEAIPSSSEH
jgi:hypothetical protein